MPDWIAIKKLSASDLTLLDRFFGVINRTGQKCINLNADIFVDRFYPDIEALAAPHKGEIAVPLTIFGPAGSASPVVLNRKVTKGDTYKNWRLNGETIHDPSDDPNRFASLQQHDLAIMAFDGKGLPEKASLIFLARSEADDAALYAQFAPLVAGRSMAALTPEGIEAAIAAAGIGQSHPLATFGNDAEIEAALEDAALGGVRGLRIVRRRRVSRPVSSAERERSQRAAEKTGDDGERLVNTHFETWENPGGEVNHSWASRIDAYSPFDFRVTHSGGVLGDAHFLVDAKSTSGAFDRDFHISGAELREAADNGLPYLIYRVYGLGPGGTMMRISNDIRDFATALLAAHDAAMPQGVVADGFAVQVAAPGLTWSHPVALLAQVDEIDEC